MLKYIYDRLCEASTWRGIVAFLAAAGATISDDMAKQIIAAGLGIIGFIGMFFKDKAGGGSTEVK
jgi:hypothetical protein